MKSLTPTLQEAAFIRSQLALRFNHAFSCWEVYTTIHGTGVFRWMRITVDVAKWYLSHFKCPIVESAEVDSVSGAIVCDGNRMTEEALRNSR